MLEGFRALTVTITITQHDFRRIVATYLVIVGIPVDMNMKIMGGRIVQ